MASTTQRATKTPVHDLSAHVPDASVRADNRSETTLIMTAKLNDIDPQAWLADVLARIASLPQGRLRELLPWNWSAHVRSVAPPQAA